jgi:dipeptidyl aminopeptidase/acylaminoacyl peptidase
MFPLLRLCLLGLGAAVASAPAADVATAPSAAAGPEASNTAVRRPLSPADFYEVLTVSDPQVSPDGRWVAYVVTGNDRDADEPRSAVWMVSWDGEQQITLTTSSKGAHAPRWSPDGRYLSFLASQRSSGNAQLMMLDRRGGEATALTDPNDDIGDYAWSPDGRHLTLVIQRSHDEPPKQAIRAIVINALHFKQDENGYLGAGQDHLYLLDVETRKIESLTGGSGVNEHLPAWSPDGRRIAFVSTREKDSDPDGMQDIDMIDAHAGAAAQRVLRTYSPNRQRLQWSPDGAYIAYFLGEEPKYNQYIQNRLAIVSVAQGRSRTLAQSLDRPVSSYAFAHDSDSIWATIEDDGRAYAARIDLRSGAPEKAADGAFVVWSVSEAAGHAAVLYSDDASPAEVYALDAGKLRKLTRHNDAWLAAVKLGEVEELRFRNRDGTEIHGLLVKPAGFASGHRYPTLLWIHGGPNGQDAHALATGGDQFKRQLLAADGFVVFGINYRGSSARGRAFADAILADWGHKEVEDLLAGTDYLIARGIADPERLGIGGWSYGGILTDYVIARDRRFKAAFSGAGSANTLAMYGSDEYVIQYNNELGAPWTNTARWLKLSYPFLHADRIHTPTLFMGGTQDFDVPLIGGEQMYQALRTLGVSTQLVIYPGEYHELKRPSFLEDRARRIAEWFDSRLKPQR